MIETTTDAARDSARSGGISDRLQETRTAVDHVLQEVALRPAEARRFVTRDLGFEPRPAVLRAISIIAREESSGRTWGDLPRELLALHVLLARELNDLLDSPLPDAARLRRGGKCLPDLLLELRAIESDLIQAVADAADPAVRTLLLEVAAALAPCEDRLVAAAVLAPRLALLLCCAAVDAAPASRQDESGPHAGGTNGCRAVQNAVALQLLIEEDLARLAELDADPERDPRGAALAATVERLRALRIAYRVVAACLGEHQEAAIEAGLSTFAEAIGRAKAELFTAHLKLVPVFRRSTVR